MTDKYDEMNDVEVSAHIEAMTWPVGSPVAALQGYKGTDEERKAAVVQALRAIDAENGRAK